MRCGFFRLPTLNKLLYKKLFYLPARENNEKLTFLFQQLKIDRQSYFITSCLSNPNNLIHFIFKNELVSIKNIMLQEMYILPVTRQLNDVSYVIL